MDVVLEVLWDSDCENDIYFEVQHDGHDLTPKGVKSGFKFCMDKEY